MEQSGQDGGPAKRKGKAARVGASGPHIVQKPGYCGGKPHIAGHRISVQNVAIWHERMGWSAHQISAEYNLSLGQIYAALAYYFDHREEIDRSIADDEAFVAEMKGRRSGPSASADLPCADGGRDGQLR